MSESNDSSRRLSNRVSKRKSDVATNCGNEKSVRKCSKTGCNEKEPTCCLLSCESCSKSGYTSRWYHMSLWEHFCNNCFDNYYRPSKSGNPHFNEWCSKWGFAARASRPTIKCFVANELLPYWLKCSNSNCQKWRMVRKPGILNSEFIKNFKCSSINYDKNPCDVEEDESISHVSDYSFIEQLAEQPLLKHSPAGPYLARFLPEDVGICPIDGANSSYKKVENIDLFIPTQCGESCIWVKPDTLDEDETELVKRLYITHAIYLSLRNFLIALWNLTPSHWLMMDRVVEHIVCRGLVRIYLVKVAEQVLELLTCKSAINYGIIKNPSAPQLESVSDQRVLVIGAGVAGLAAASHLQNLGVNVTVYEATSCLGGRIKDHPMEGIGAFLVQGSINNPILTLAIQAGVSYQTIASEVTILRQNGEVVSDSDMEKVTHEFRNLFQGAIEWAMINNKDRGCFEFLMESCNKMKEQTSFCCDPELFEQHVSLLEIELKANLSDLTLKNFEFVLPLEGDNIVISNGLSVLSKKLSKNLGIIYNKEVKEINYTQADIKVITSDGAEAAFTKVLVTIPISVLRRNIVKFVPSLPEFKQKALNGLSDYYLEKLILVFPKKFWTKVPNRQFCIMSSNSIFDMFYDVTADKKSPTLVAIIPQKSFPLIENVVDKEIVNMCLTFLKKVFSCDIPKPTKWFLSHWRDEHYSGSYGSHVRVGNELSVYDDLAEVIDDKVYFAGEATFRNIPSTITGAFLSGLREAANIMKNLNDN